MSGTFKRYQTQKQWILAIFFLIFATETLALPADFSNELALGGLTQPVDVVELPSGEMLILEKRGTIVLADPTVSPTVSSLYLTIPSVDGKKEKGLLSIVLDPDFQSNQYFYVFYHNRWVDRSRISRFLHNGSSASLQSELVVWQDNIATSAQTIANHYGGGMSFGPDGYLYFTYGDKRDFPTDAQDLQKTAGKILRLNPAGANSGGPWVNGSANAHLIPADNPYVDGAGGTPDEIWALGLRNPFTAEWDFPTGRMLIGEVGDNVQSGVDASYEDLHVVTTSSAGANFGYPLCEGPVCNGGAAPANYSPSIFSIRHPDSRAIILGPVYRGNSFPAQYDSALFFGDYANGWLRYLTFDTAGAVSANVPAGGFEFAPEGSMTNIVSMIASAEGDLYYLTMGPRFEPTSAKGQLRRITYDSTNSPPVITTATVNPTSGGVQPLTVEFSGAATDPDGDVLSYTWDFGDGSTASNANVSHTYTTPGSFEAVLRVEDGITASTSPPVTISVGAPPVATIDLPVANSSFTAGNIIEVRGSASDADGTLTNDSLRWTVQFNHDDHAHPVVSGEIGIPCQPAGSSCLTFQVPVSGHDFSGDTGYEITLEVTDSTGISRTDTVAIIPDKVDLSFNSDFPGDMRILLDQLPRSLPFELDTLIGFEHTIEAPETLYANNDGYAFSLWSNGPTEALQNFAVPSTNSAYTASYTNTGPVSFPQGGLVAHFESDSGVSLDASGQVTAWSDLSGRGNDLLSAGDPQLVNSSLNGRVVIDFDGTGDALLRTGGLNDFPEGAQDRTVYMVVSYEGTGSGGFGYGTSARNKAFGLSINSIGNLRVNAFGPTDKTSTTVGTNAGWMVQSAHVSSNQLVHAVNGLEIDSAARSYNTSSDLMVLGADLDQTPAVDMQVAAVMVYDRALSESEKTQLQGYLQGKYFGPVTTNQAPVAVADTGTVVAGGTVLIDVLSNDSDDVALAINTISIVSEASAGTVTVNTDGTLSYVHDNSATSQDTFTYTVEDDEGLVSNQATVTMTITGTQVNQAPVAQNDSATLEAGDTVLINILSNDTDDVAIVANTVQIVSGVSNGSLQLNADGTVSYTHNDGPSPVDVFTYTVEDAQGLVSNEATVTLTITGTGVGPSIPQSGLVAHFETDSGVAVNGSGRVTAWSDQSGQGNDLLSAGDPQLINGGLNGQAVIDFDGSGDALLRSSALNSFPQGAQNRTVYMVVSYEGTGSGGFGYGTSARNRAFGLSVNDAGNLRVNAFGRTDVTSNTIGTNAGWIVQSARVASNQLVHSVNGAEIDSAARSYNTSGDLMVLGADLDQSPAVDMQVAALMVYDRALNATEQNQLQGYLQDKYFGTITANQAPVAVADNVSVNVGGTVLINVLGNDSDDSGLAVDSVVIVTDASNGLVTVNTDGTLSYVHDNSAGTVDTFTYTVADEDGLVSNQATVTVSITNSGNQAPIARADNGTVVAGGTVLINVLDNDSDDSALAVNSVQIVSNSSVGTELANSDGTVSYTHNNGSIDQDAFTYTVEDEDGLVSNEAVVSLMITGVVTGTSIPQSGLVAHFETDSGVLLDGASKVTGWIDQSGQGNDLLAVGDPTLTSGGLNGQAVIDFDGAGDVLFRTDTLNEFPLGGADRTVYLVTSYEGVGSGGFGYGASARNKAFGLSVNSLGNLRINAFGPNDKVSSTVGTDAGWIVQSARLASNQLVHSVNGVEIDSAARAYATSGNTLVLGADLDQSPAVDMRVAAVLVYNRALTAAEEQSVQSYFTSKYFD